jgi:hypothetical protein
MARKAFSISLALALLLFSLEACWAYAATCWARCDTVSPRYAGEATGVCQPLDACCRAMTCPCDLSQGCRLELLPDFSISALPRPQSPAPAGITAAAIDVFTPLNFPGSLAKKVSTLRIGSSVCFYLLNHSFLC